MAVVDRLTFTAEYPSGTFRVLRPVFEDITKEVSRDGDGFSRFVYRETLSDDLLLVDDDQRGISDYSWLKAIEESDVCAKPVVTVQCDGEDFFSGLLKLTKASFDKRLCRATVPLEPEDGYTPLFDVSKEEQNVLAGGNAVTIYFTPGEYETAICPPQTVSGTYATNQPLTVSTCLSNPSHGWALFQNEITNIAYNFSTNQITGTVSSTWVRERVTSTVQPPGIGWIDIGGNTWVRQPSLTLDTVNSVTWFPASSGNQWLAYYILPSAGYEFVDNSRPLWHVFDQVFGPAGLTVSSNFFGIDPDGLNVPSNVPYSQTLQKQIFVYQKSDVKRPTVSGNATRGMMTPDELLEWLYIQFCVFGIVDGTKLRLEHVSYFTQGTGGGTFDLTAPQYERYLLDKQRYEYNGQQVPRTAYWYWQDHDASRVLFQGDPVTYSAHCSEKETRPEDLRLTRVTNDISQILSRPDDFADDGFVFVTATLFNGQYYFDYETTATPNSSAYLMNGFLSFPNLLDKFWRHWGWLPSGTLNRQAVSYAGSRPLRKLEPVTIPGMCCGDFNSISPSGAFLHPCGTAELETMTYSAKKKTATFELTF